MITVIETNDGRVLVTDRAGKALDAVIKEAREDMIELGDIKDIKDEMFQTKRSYIIVNAEMNYSHACRP